MAELVPVTRTVVETEEKLRRLLNHKMATGRLVTPIDQITSARSRKDPQKWAIRATFLEPAPKPTLRQRWAGLDKAHPIGGPLLKAGLFGLAVLAGLGGIGFALVEVIAHTVTRGMLTSLGGGLLVLGLLIALAGRGGGSGHHSGKGWHYTNCK